jgi:pimeloyl-ACP methyl ester carboxylesterase
MSPRRSPLVLLHGGGADRHAWAPLREKLPGDTAVVALDLPGHGTEPGCDYGPAVVEDFADWVVAQILALDIQPPHVIGHSMGGAVALEVARRISVAAVTALAPIGFWTPARGRYAAAVLRYGARLGRRLSPVTRGRMIAMPLARRLAFALFSAHPAAISPDNATQMATALADSDIVAMSRYTGRYRFQPGKEITAPITLVWAGHDRLVARRDAQRAARLLPHAVHFLLPTSLAEMRRAPIATVEQLASAAGCTPKITMQVRDYRQGQCKKPEGLIVFLSFSTDEGKRKWLDYAQMFGGIYLVGNRWVLSSKPRDAMDALKDKLGGNIEEMPSMGSSHGKNGQGGH